jgi:hypothetical protein
MKITNTPNVFLWNKKNFNVHFHKTTKGILLHGKVLYAGQSLGLIVASS